MAQYLSVKEAASELGVSPSTVRRLIKAGKIAAVQQNRRTVVPKRALIRFHRVDPIEDKEMLQMQQELRAALSEMLLETDGLVGDLKGVRETVNQLVERRL